ncbi:hypothetical protein [Cupriavidus sp. TMH.W2]|uniref:hypothetical protein n=1 Tax=Cupriavidus sp. TMH.W2 TaxID=3434465 RepID=UPI003D76DC34
MSQLSRLDVLTLDQLTALRAWRQGHGRSWRRELMDHYATGRDANSPALRQIRNQHMELLAELTSSDFTLPLTVYYGTVACDRANGETLRAMGVEVGEFDDEAASFHVRVNRLALSELSQHAADFPVVRLTAIDDHAAFPWDQEGGVETASADALRSFAAKVDYLIHTRELSHSTRAPELNWFSDRLDEVNARLAKLLPDAVQGVDTAPRTPEATNNRLAVEPM